MKTGNKHRGCTIIGDSYKVYVLGTDRQIKEGKMISSFLLLPTLKS